VSTALRVLDAAGHILADVGGPYVIAPVTGVLRSGGRPGGVDHRAWARDPPFADQEKQTDDK